MPLILPRRLMKGSASSPAVSLINRGAYVSSADNLTTYDFTSYPIGAASSTRRVIAVIHGDIGSAAVTLSSATIGGVSAAIDAQANGGAGSTNLTAIISATVTSGTTATISVTFSGGLQRAACKAIAVDNLLSVSPYATATDNADPLSATIDWLADGVVVGGSGTDNGTLACAWAGITETEEIDYESTDASSADLFPTANGVSQTVSATWTGGTFARSSMAVASYR